MIRTDRMTYEQETDFVLAARSRVHQRVLNEFPDGATLVKIVELVELRAVCAALEETEGNGRLAADVLGINRTTLVEMRRRHGLPLRV